ncbi:MAG: hypothetical protein NVS86_00330 [Candidatus Carsonella ruddii]|nr:MAG: hypothetical protein NVS86_00330 [Candidatus Carsonella ruddii]
MDFFPLYDKIVVVKIDTDNKVGNIFVPINDNNILKGKVLKTGCGKLLENGDLKSLIVKKNDIILFKDNFNIDKYKNNNIEYFFLKESDIITIIN